MTGEALSAVLRQTSLDGANWTMDTSWHLNEVWRLLYTASDAGAADRNEHAALAYDEALELDPSLVPALDGRRRLTAALSSCQSSPKPATGSEATGNHSAAFAMQMQASVQAGHAVELSADPAIHVLHDLLSRSEAAQLLALRDSIRKRWATVPPLVCFDHAELQYHPALQPFLQHGIGDRGRRSCLNQTASAAVAASRLLSFSEALSTRLGESDLIDEIGRRLERRTGLRDARGAGFQLLEYSAGSAFHSHTDCHRWRLEQGTRMASVLVYLTDDFDGGETEFTKLGPLRLKPPVGSAVVFYNYGRPADGLTTCDPRSEHRSVPVRRGSKAVLQRWYGYSDQGMHHRAASRQTTNRFGSRALRHPSLRLPFQPVVKCDQLPDAAVSCRLYNEPGGIVFVEEARSHALTRCRGRSFGAAASTVAIGIARAGCAS